MIYGDFMSVAYNVKAWVDNSNSGTTITASELNRMEVGINNCKNAINNSENHLNVIASKVFSNMTIEGVARDGTATVHVYGEGVVTSNEADVLIATVGSSYKPVYAVRSLFGVNDGKWGILTINQDGSIRLNQRYGTGSVTWGIVDVTVSYVY